ncbi:hypothetical protein BDZ45DRAFT_710027 [Acephala macrosclerotiorum]|nr:hypothetical protein BDZ45DRAFT_710027 [Acephala macrosclerotiorum]
MAASAALLTKPVVSGIRWSLFLFSLFRLTESKMRVRVFAYKLLRKVGHRLYGRPNAYEPVQRLPFGLYLKYLGDPDGFRNEFNALQMVRRHTSFTLLDKDDAEFVAQMQDYPTQVQAIPRAVSPEYAICDTLGRPCRDRRIYNANPVEPFVNKAAFSQVLRNPDEPSRREHKVVFTHVDLNSRNILVNQVIRLDGTQGWTVTGIVDWENSGYYPKYWDYTKVLFEGFRYTQGWRDFMHEIFKPFGDLSKEFEVEKRSW